MVLEKLEPAIVWDIFEDVFTKTFRESKREDKIRERIKKFIGDKNEELGLNIKIYEDEAGNILLKKEASYGMEDCSPLLLQGHMDMVVETNIEGGFDFEKNPLPLTIEENQEWVTAKGTTLGADNGIGVSMAIALLLDMDLSHGPLEILITVDEETGLTGAFEMNLDSLPIKSKQMINVDSEKLGNITIGSAGGGGVRFHKKFEYIDCDKFNRTCSEYTVISLKVEGLLGGHSGADIHKNRGNAHKIGCKLLNNAIDNMEAKAPMEFFIHSWNGGSKHNAIPREAEIIFIIPNAIKQQFIHLMEEERQLILAQFSKKLNDGRIMEPNLQISIRELQEKSLEIGGNPIVISEQDSLDLLSTISIIHHGVVTFSQEVPNLVETSNNLAIVKTNHERGEFSIELSARSSIDSELRRFRTNLQNLGDLGNWTVTLKPSYPGWEPKPDNEFVHHVQMKYSEILGDEVEVKAIHAGLETGIIGAKIPGIEMVSMGPDIQNPHTPDERVNINSVEIFYTFLKKFIEDFHEYEPKRTPELI